MRNKITLKSINDPGHGWLVVSHALIVELGIQDKISGYSYMTHDKVYLEEDSDAFKLLSALHENGYNITCPKNSSPYWNERNVEGNDKVVKIDFTHTNKSARCRTYPRYNAEGLGLFTVGGEEFEFAYGCGNLGYAKIIGEADKAGLAGTSKPKTLFHVEVRHFDGQTKRFYVPKTAIADYLCDKTQKNSLKVHTEKHAAEVSA